MADEAIILIETPDTCGETTEYKNNIEEDDLEPALAPDIADEEEEEEEEPEAEESSTRSKNSNESEQRFAEFERNYRARRIRELARAPLKKKRGSRPETTTDNVMA